MTHYQIEYQNDFFKKKFITFLSDHNFKVENGTFKKKMRLEILL